MYRKRVLRWSETFIAEQARALPRYTVTLAGVALHDTGEHLLQGLRVETLSHGGLFGKLSGWAFGSLGWVPRSWRQRLRTPSPSLIHAHFGTEAAPASALARALRIPLVITYHGMDITGPARNQREVQSRRRGFAAATRVVAVSRFVADALRRAGCPDEKIEQLYIGVDTTRFAPSTNPAPRSSNTVLFVGRLQRMKGAHILIEAMATLREELPTLKSTLRIVGDGPERPRLEALATELRCHVRFLGVLCPDDVRNEMQQATLLCGPSLTDASGSAEALGMAFVEAQACGCPVIVADTGGAAETVADGETGFVVPAGDVAALAARIRDVLQDATLAAAMGERGRARVLRYFDLHQQTARLAAVYDEVAAPSEVLLA